MSEYDYSWKTGHLTPELAARLAAAFGIVMATGKTICISSSHHSVSRIIKQSIRTALQGVGVDVIDIGDGWPAISRFAVRHLHTAGAIHVQMAAGRCCLYGFDHSALPLAADDLHQIKKVMSQSKMIPEAKEQPGQYYKHAHMMDTYSNHVAAACGAFIQPTCEPYQIIVAAAPAVFSAHDRLYRKLGLKVLHAAASEQTELQQLIQSSKADLAVWLEEDGKIGRLFTSKGRAIEKSKLLSVVYAAFFHSFPSIAIGAPASAPVVLEQLAKQLGCQLVRTKATARSMMEPSAALPMHPLYDGLFGTALIIQQMMRTGLSLEGLLTQCPDLFWEKESNNERNEGRKPAMFDLDDAVFHEAAMGTTSDQGNISNYLQ